MLTQTVFQQDCRLYCSRGLRPFVLDHNFRSINMK